MTSKSLSQRPSDLVGIDPDNTYERFEFDQAVSGLGRFVDGKLEQLHPKTFKPMYPNLESVLKLAKKSSEKEKPKAIKSAPKPNFRRKKKKRES